MSHAQGEDPSSSRPEHQPLRPVQAVASPAKVAVVRTRPDTVLEDVGRAMRLLRASLWH